jgi:soluble lytic murein transglycosylase-like protein
VWWLVRTSFRLFRRLAWWQQVGLVVLAPLVALNLSVAFFGSSVVSPVSPFFLAEKWGALKAYAKHRPRCLLSGHPEAQRLAADAEVRYRLPKGLMQAVVEVESEGHAHRISAAGAMGPAQLMPGTAAMLGVKDAFDSKEAIDGGAKYLMQLLERTGDVQLAIAAYNAGPGAVRGAVPKNGETEFYVARVMRRFNTARD